MILYKELTYENKFKTIVRVISEYTTCVEVEVDDLSKLDEIVFQAAANKIEKYLPNEAIELEGISYIPIVEKEDINEE